MPEANSPAGQKVVDAILEMASLDPDAAAAWLNTHETEFDDHELATIIFEGDKHGIKISAINAHNAPQVQDRINRGKWFKAGAPKSIPVNVPDLKTLADQAVAGGLQTGQANQDLTGDGVTSDAEKKAFATATEKAAKTAHDAQAKATGSEVAATQAADTTKGVLAGLNASSSPPDFIVNQITGGAQPTPGQEASMIAAWNKYHPESPVTDATELYSRMKNVAGAGNPINLADPHVVSILQAAVLGEDPIVDYTVKLSADRSMKLDAATYQTALQNLGLKPSDVAAYARAADRSKLLDGSGQPNWQILAMIEKARNGGQAGTIEQDHAAKIDLTAGKPADVKANAAPPTPGAPNLLTHPDAAIRALKTQQDALSYQEGLRRYDQNDELALIYTIDQGLAARLAALPPDKWSSEDKRRLSQIELTAGFSKKSLAAVGQGGLDITDYQDPETKKLGADQKQLQAESIARQKYEADRNKDGIPDYKQQPKLDQTKVRQAAKDLYQSLFFAEPTDAELARLVGAANSAQASGNGFDQTDPQAALEGAAKTSGAYSELYRNKPGGMSEAEYAQQFKSGVGDIAGAQANPEAIRAGLRTGQYQTAVGAAATGAGIFNNSTFMGRLAGAGQVFSEFT